MSTPADESMVDLRKPVESWHDHPLGIIHAGSRYDYGYGPDYYGIWDKQAPGSPVERFPLSDDARTVGWDRYVRLEPSAEGVDIRPINPPWIDQMNTKASKRGRWIVVGALLAFVGVMVGLLVVKNTGAGGSGGSGIVAAGSKARIEVTSPVVVSQDLTAETFEARGFDSLNPSMDATWKSIDGNMTLTLSMDTPRVGEVTTKDNPKTRLQIEVTGQPTFLSRRGECTLTFGQVDDANLAGSFTCVGVPAVGGEGTLDASGTFAATTG